MTGCTLHDAQQDRNFASSGCSTYQVKHLVHLLCEGCVDGRRTKEKEQDMYHTFAITKLHTKAKKHKHMNNMNKKPTSNDKQRQTAEQTSPKNMNNKNNERATSTKNRQKTNNNTNP